MVVPGAKYGMGRWRYNNPATARRISTVTLLGSAVNLLIIVVSVTIGQVPWALLLSLPLMIWAMAGLFVYWTGPKSGWRGAWHTRFPIRLEELLPRIEDSLRSAGFDVQRDEPARKPAWLRNSHAVLDLGGGLQVWMMPGVPGSRAGLNPRLQPLTTVAIQGGSALSVLELERVRKVLSGAAGPVTLA